MPRTVSASLAAFHTYAAFLLTLSLTAGSTLVAVAENLQIEVREPAGIRRFGYPVAVVLPIPPSAPKTIVCALHDADRVVPAQLRREETDDGTGRWWLDFNLSLMPHESRRLKLGLGEQLAGSSEPRAGLAFIESPEEYQVKNGDHIAWTLGRQGMLLVKQVRVPAYEHLRECGLQLAWSDRDGNRHKVGGDDQRAKLRVVRSGPLVVALRDEAALTELSPPVRSIVDMTFPASKSWVQVEWRIEDAASAVAAASAEIDLNLDSPTESKPTLVDFGASTLVYMALLQGQSGILRSTVGASDAAGHVPDWEVLRGKHAKLEPFVAIPLSGEQRMPAEGWAHVMDRTRCLAVALDEFGKKGDDSIEVTAEGKVTLTRRFLAGAAQLDANRRLRFWLHFVGFPPHETAATSPQSMLAPLVVRVSAE